MIELPRDHRARASRRISFLRDLSGGHEPVAQTTGMRNQRWRRGTFDRPGILAEMQALLQHYRAELLAESGRLLQEGAT
jgi:hypothetical protein